MPITPRLYIPPSGSGAPAGYAVYSAFGLNPGAQIGLAPDRLQTIIVEGNLASILMNPVPFGLAPPFNGTTIRLIGNSDAFSVKLQTNDAPGGCILSGDAELGAKSAIELQYIAALDRYVQISDSFKVP